MKKFIMLAIALCIVTVLAACGDDTDSAKKNDNETNTEEQANQKVKITDKEKVNNDDVVVQINGTDVKGDQYNDVYAQTKTLMNQYGEDVSDQDKLKEQAMNVLVQQELLKQDANKQGITVSDEEVESELDKMKSAGKDKFSQVLEQYNLTEESYKDQLAFELTLREYIDQEITGTEVTEEEIKSYYDKLKEQSEDVPELKKVKDQIKSQLTTQKENEKVQAKVNELKEDAEIKNMI
ncbi:SurA N-terminal domain-containing protein [Lentibacillus sp. Marseille-P4043]|uniref:SurA N-terminal domain-containing protein n=1 Tax=Lentibacillus sp. Marseille-P4043 TaxID=2040293 RepID=UPI000D0B595F|nr:SurA N-terminal domain-containing protein [Lentibacillus sp. Marseille-P4043]